MFNYFNFLIPKFLPLVCEPLFWKKIEFHFSNIFVFLSSLLFRDIVKFRHPQVNNAPFENNEKCSKLINRINDTHLNKAFVEALSIHDRISNLEHDLDLKHVDTINTTTITSLARHIIPAKHQHEILDLHHEQRPYEEASKIIAKKFVSDVNKKKKTLNSNLLSNSKY